MGPSHDALPCCLDCMKPAKQGSVCPKCQMPVCEVLISAFLESAFCFLPAFWWNIFWPSSNISTNFKEHRRVVWRCTGEAEKNGLGLLCILSFQVFIFFIFCIIGNVCTRRGTYQRVWYFITKKREKNHRWLYGTIKNILGHHNIALSSLA